MTVPTSSENARPRGRTSLAQLARHHTVPRAALAPLPTASLEQRSHKPREGKGGNDIFLRSGAAGQRCQAWQAWPVPATKVLGTHIARRRMHVVLELAGSGQATGAATGETQVVLWPSLSQQSQRPESPGWRLAQGSLNAGHADCGRHVLACSSAPHLGPPWPFHSGFSGGILHFQVHLKGAEVSSVRTSKDDSAITVLTES